MVFPEQIVGLGDAYRFSLIRAQDGDEVRVSVIFHAIPLKHERKVPIMRKNTLQMSLVARWLPMLVFGGCTWMRQMNTMQR